MAGPDVLDAEASAYTLLEQVRWAGSPRCPHCGSDMVGYLRPADGRSRRTRTGTATARRVWRCATCRRQFSVLTGTLLHGTRIPLQVWLSVVSSLARDAVLPPVEHIATTYGVSRDAARHLHRLLAGACAERAVRDELAG